MSKVQVLIAGKLLSDTQASAVKIALTQTFLKLHYWLHSNVTLGTPDFAPKQETIDHYLRLVEMLHLLDPEYIKKCLSLQHEPKYFTITDGVATANFTLEQVVEHYNRSRRDFDAHHNETYHR
jgi:hypothetical protein